MNQNWKLENCSLSLSIYYLSFLFVKPLYLLNAIVELATREDSFRVPGRRIMLVHLESGVFQCSYWLRTSTNMANRNHLCELQGIEKGD